MANYAQPCNRSFMWAANHSGKRKPTDTIKWVVLHSTEGGSAESVARFFHRPPNDDVGSTQIVVDDGACFRSLPNDVIPHGSPGANERGWHVEQCGFARWSVTTWLLHRDTLRRAAYKAVENCPNVPRRFVFAADLKLGKPGYTTHREVSKAFGGDHTDPGPFWPRRLFMRYVREYAEQLNV